MKSPFYILTALLPIAAVAVPTAEAADDSLEERGNGGGGGGHRWGNDGDHDRDPCVVKKTYWYHKYPCVSSETVGESKVGDKFQPVCKYQNWYKNSKGWWVMEENKPYRCQVNPPQCP